VAAGEEAAGSNSQGRAARDCALLSTLTQVGPDFVRPVGVAGAIQTGQVGLDEAGLSRRMRAVDAQPRKANLFIVGAPKCGTTAWVEYLRTHPEIFFPDSKEDCFFALDLPRFRFKHSEAEYAELFVDSGDAKFVGEASAMYLFSEAAAEAMRDYNPASKILIFLRDQEEYLPSLHNQFLWEFSEEIEDFETVWRLSGQRPAETIPATCLEPRTLDYAAMGRFNEQVGRYLAAFPFEQIRVIRFHDWTTNPRATYLEILDFLGLADDGRAEFPRINGGMTYRSRRLVRFIHHPPNFLRKLARLFKRLTSLKSETLILVAQKSVNLLSSQGYKRQISPKLRDEIRRHYAKDNRQLDDRLRSAATMVSSSPRRRNEPAQSLGH
jgi:hypothetical protein